jgi:biopolymer transport protein ExbD/biopolymer transport protein TolR
MSSSLKLDLPKSDAAAPSDSPQYIAVALDLQGRLYFGDEMLDRPAFTLRVGDAARKNPQLEVQLRADKGVSYGSVAELIGIVQMAGLSRIGFIAEPTGSAPSAR